MTWGAVAVGGASVLGGQHKHNYKLVEKATN
jgi:hypothetical protein